MEESKEIFNVHLPEDHQTSRRIRNLEGIIHPLNVTHVIIWDTLLYIVLLINIGSRKRIESTMPMQLKRNESDKERTT